MEGKEKKVYMKISHDNLICQRIPPEKEMWNDAEYYIYKYNNKQWGTGTCCKIIFTFGLYLIPLRRLRNKYINISTLKGLSHTYQYDKERASKASSDGVLSQLQLKDSLDKEIDRNNLPKELQSVIDGFYVALNNATVKFSDKTLRPKLNKMVYNLIQEVKRISKLKDFSVEKVIKLKHHLENKIVDIAFLMTDKGMLKEAYILINQVGHPLTELYNSSNKVRDGNTLKFPGKEEEFNHGN